MAYCVNCGVELEQSLKRCPLCNTPTYHPTQKSNTEIPAPYPNKRGEVSRVKKTDQAILISVIIICTAIGCGVLNLLVFRGGLWSLYIMGICGVLWVFSIPVMLYQNLPFALMFLFDGAAVSMYCGIISYRFDGGDWYLGIALPVIGMATVLIIGIGYLYQYASKSILLIAMAVFLAIGVFCAGINLCVSKYITGSFSISWAAVVLTCSVIIAITLFTIMRVSRLREEVRRRMHI